MSSMKEKTNVLQYKNMGGKSITIKTVQLQRKV